MIFGKTDTEKYNKALTYAKGVKRFAWLPKKLRCSGQYVCFKPTGPTLM